MSPKLLVAAVAVVNLVAGLAIGATAGRLSAPCSSLHAHHAFEHLRGPTRPYEGELEHAVVVERTDFPALANALHLEPQEDARLRAILASVRPRFATIMRDVHPRLEALHAELVSELGTVLSEAQMKELAAEYHRQTGRESPTPR